jgi:hypothetical protein
MPQAFDPYHRWLGIPPKRQPANHYRLLGLELFETDPEVIRDAMAELERRDQVAAAEQQKKTLASVSDTQIKSERGIVL